jgi:hypothetical protein
VVNDERMGGSANGEEGGGSDGSLIREGVVWVARCVGYMDCSARGRSGLHGRWLHSCYCLAASVAAVVEGKHAVHSLDILGFSSRHCLDKLSPSQSIWIGLENEQIFHLNPLNTYGLKLKRIAVFPNKLLMCTHGFNCCL